MRHRGLVVSACNLGQCPAQTGQGGLRRVSDPEGHDGVPGGVAQQPSHCRTEHRLAAQLLLPIHPLSHLVQGLARQSRGCAPRSTLRWVSASKIAHYPTLRRLECLTLSHVGLLYATLPNRNG